MPLSAPSPIAGRDLSELQFDILDALYFVEPYQSLLSEVVAQSGASEQLIVADLKQLIAWRYVQVLRYDEQANDWLKTPFHDADDLHAFRYLATKEGLLVHNGRR